MPDSDRGKNTPLVAFSLLFFLILIGWIGFNLGTDWQQRIHADEAAEHHQQYADDKIKSACIGIFEGELLLECIHKAIETSREHKVAEQDLDAQQQMSRYAGLLFILTGLTTLVTGAGVYYVRHTLEATQAATNAAHRAVDVTRDIGRRETRAYIGALSVSVDQKKTLHIKLTNSGGTPAVRVQSIAHFYPANSRSVVTLKSADPSHPSTIGPSGILNIFLSPNVNILHKAEAANENICVFIYVRYYDAYKSLRRTIFEFEIVASGDGFEAIPTKKGNRST